MYPTKETAHWKPPPWNGECPGPHPKQTYFVMFIYINICIHTICISTIIFLLLLYYNFKYAVH